MKKGDARYEIECSVDAGRGEHCRFVPRSDQNHHDQTESQELVYNAEPVESFPVIVRTISSI